MFLFAGAMSIGPESIAGEKDRNTISTLLITPIKRTELAIGKVLSLSFLSLVSSVSSFIGIILALPALLNLEDQSLSVFSFTDYLLILVVLFSTIFVIIGIVSVISAYARSLKEASTYITPIYIITIIVSITTMFSTGANTNFLVYVIPIYNAVQSLVGIMTFSENIGIYVLITAISNFIYMIGFVYLLTRMFNSEKIMFKK
jgi:sodium transport system permease protein